MKIKIGGSVLGKKSFKIANFLILIFAVLATSSCQTSKDLPNKKLTSEDCSTVFLDSTKNAATVSDDKSSNISQCKVLHLQISDKIKCDISASNKVDNLLISHVQNSGNGVMFVAPLEALKGLSDNVSYKDQIKYYFLIQKIKRHIDTDLFNSLKDFRYKGMNCSINGDKFTSWISEKEIIVTYEGNKKEVKTGRKIK